MPRPEQIVAKILKQKGYTLGTVESATGGLISHLVTGIPGSSEFFRGGIIAYSNDIKLRLAGVNGETLQQYGAVSSQVAGQMASGGLRLLGSDVCLADTGIAGPGGATGEKPVGLVFVAAATHGRVQTRRYQFEGSRIAIKKAFAAVALEFLAEFLESQS